MSKLEQIEEKLRALRERQNDLDDRIRRREEEKNKLFRENYQEIANSIDTVRTSMRAREQATQQIENQVKAKITQFYQGLKKVLEADENLAQMHAEVEEVVNDPEKLKRWREQQETSARKKPDLRVSGISSSRRKPRHEDDVAESRRVDTEENERPTHQPHHEPTAGGGNLRKINLPQHENKQNPYGAPEKKSEAHFMPERKKSTETAPAPPVKQSSNSRMGVRANGTDINFDQFDILEVGQGKADSPKRHQEDASIKRPPSVDRTGNSQGGMRAGETSGISQGQNKVIAAPTAHGLPKPAPVVKEPVNQPTKISAGGNQSTLPPKPKVSQNTYNYDDEDFDEDLDYK